MRRGLESTAASRRRRALWLRRMWLALQMQGRRRRGIVIAPTRSPGPLLTGLVAYWKLEETSGQPRMDSHVNGFHLTDFGGVDQGAGRRGFGADFTRKASDRWMECPDRAALRPVGDFTISCWLRLGTEAGTVSGIYCKTVGLELTVEPDEGPVPKLSLSDGSGDLQVEMRGRTLLAVGEWRHVVVCRGADRVRVYQNGALESESVYAGAVGAGDGTIIGATAWGLPFPGCIDEVGFWGRSLSQAEIAALYWNGNGITYEDFWV